MSDPSDAVPRAADALDSADAGGRFIRGGLIRLMAYGVGLLISLVSAPLVIRHLGPSGYGYFATVTAIVFIVGGFTEGGLNALGVREFASGRPDRHQLLRNLVGLRVSATAAAISVVAIAAALVGAPAVIVYGVLLAGVGLVVTIMGENYGIPLSAELRITAVSALGLIQQTTLAACYIVLVVIGARVLPMVAATILSGTVLLGGTVVLIRGQVSIRPAFDRKAWWELIRQTLPYAMATAVGIIYFREALVLMSVLTSERQVSYYSAAFRIVEVLTVVPWQLVSAAFPILSRAAHMDDDARLAYALQRLFDTGLIAGVWMAASIVIGARFGIAVVAGHGFGPSITVLQIQGLAIIASFMAALFGSLLLSLRLFGPLLRVNAVAVAVATLLSLTLIPHFGADGAAVAPTTAEACLAFGYWWSLQRARPALRISVGLVPRVGLATAVALGVTYALPLASAPALFVFGALYFACLAMLKAIPFEVINAILRREPPSPP